MFEQNKITFTAIREEDIPLLQKWLSEPHVHEWYDKDKGSSIEEVEKRYSPKINKNSPTQGFIVFYDNKPIGYIQSCFVNDYPEFGPYLGYDDDTRNVDIFIGENDYVGKGLGTLILKQFLKNIIFSDNRTKTCLIDPEPDNIRAIKSYQRAGFKYVKTVKLPDQLSPFYLMELKKEDFI